MPYGLPQGYPYGTTTTAAASSPYFANPTISNNGNTLENSTTIENEEKLNISGQNDENIDQQNSSEEKRSRPRWKIGDFCLARWNEDGEVCFDRIFLKTSFFVMILVLLRDHFANSTAIL